MCWPSRDVWSLSSTARLCRTAPTPIFWGHRRNKFVADFTGVNFYSGSLATHDSLQLATVDVAPGVRFHAMAEDVPSGKVSIALKPWDVTLSPLPPEGSARNALAGTVQEVQPAGGRVRVLLNVGESREIPLVAEISLEALADLGCSPGQTLVASFKATALSVEPAAIPPARQPSLVASRGNVASDVYRGPPGPRSLRMRRASRTPNAGSTGTRKEIQREPIAARSSELGIVAHATHGQMGAERFGTAMPSVRSAPYRLSRRPASGSTPDPAPSTSRGAAPRPENIQCPTPRAGTPASSDTLRSPRAPRGSPRPALARRER